MQLNNSRVALGAAINAKLSSSFYSPNATEEDVLRDLVGVNGVGISFGSKILRMLDPVRFPVFDDVLAGAFKVTKCLAQYGKFCGKLKKMPMIGAVNKRTGAPVTIGALEAALFLIAQPHISALR